MSWYRRLSTVERWVNSRFLNSSIRNVESTLDTENDIIERLTM